jgi:hypothetical protein
VIDLDQATLTMRLDAQDNLLRALSITQSEHTARIRRLEEGQRRLEEAVGRLEQAVAVIQAGIRDILTLLQNGGPAGTAR